MSTLEISLDAHATVFRIGGGEYLVPVGVRSLAESITGDPPAPEDLTNAIGLVLDHLDDVERELPMAAFADELVVQGDGAVIVSDVEVGGLAPQPFVLDREAAEEVFRTLATETEADRAHNPGLPAAWVHDVLGACCALVAILRRLPPDEIEVRR